MILAPGLANFTPSIFSFFYFEQYKRLHIYSLCAVVGLTLASAITIDKGFHCSKISPDPTYVLSQCTLVMALHEPYIYWTQFIQFH